MAEFFALPLIRSLQQVQKSSAYGSSAHRDAFRRMKREAQSYGAGKFFGDY